MPDNLNSPMLYTIANVFLRNIALPTHSFSLSTQQVSGLIYILSPCRITTLGDKSYNIVFYVCQNYNDDIGQCCEIWSAKQWRIIKDIFCTALEKCILVKYVFIISSLEIFAVLFCKRRGNDT